MLHRYVVSRYIQETKEVFTLEFTPMSSPRLLFIPGQFIMVHIPDEDGNFVEQGMPYSLSSGPEDPYLSITVKKIGTFPSKLHSLRIGDLIGISGPSGWFSPKPDTKHLVGLAGGIGITPFRSIMRGRDTQYKNMRITLFMSEQCKENFVFEDEFKQYISKGDGIILVKCLTQEVLRDPAYEYVRINSSLLKKYLDTFKDKEFYLCGSIVFVEDMRQMLLGESVTIEQIHTEIF